MTKQELPRLTRFLKNLCGVFGRPFTEDLLEGYAAALVDVEIDEVEENVIAFLRCGDRMPTPSDLRAGDESSPETAAIEAWNEVRKGIKTRELPSDRISAALVQSFGGMARMGGMDEGEVGGFLRREFIKLYSAREREERMHAAKVAARLLISDARQLGT